MKQTTVQMIRAHLVTASVAAMTIDAAVLSLLVFSRYPQTLFETTSFRLLTFVLLLAVVLVTRHAAHVAFRAAVKRRHARFVGPARDAVSVSSVCPARGLVMLHLRFTGMPYVAVDATGW